jgi:hypothetical protein
MTLNERIEAYMAAIEPAISGQGGHDRAYYAACRLVWGFGLSVEAAWPFMLAYNQRCVPPWNEADLRHKLISALNDSTHQQPRGFLLEGKAIPERRLIRIAPLPPPRPKLEYNPEKLARLAAKIDFEVTPEWLEARSKFTCWNRSPAGFLHKLYRAGEKVVVFNVLESQGCEVWEHKGLGQDLSTLNHLRSYQREGVWFLAQPVDGEYHWNPRQEKESRRSEESVTAWRYLVIESDEAPKDLWLKALVQLPLPIAAICDSGGDSIHALIRLDADSKKEWDAAVEEVKPSLVKLGSDPGALTGVRLTRLANCRRENKRQLQRLLYLTDSPDLSPICQRPVRESTAWRRKELISVER